MASLSLRPRATAIRMWATPLRTTTASPLARSATIKRVHTTPTMARLWILLRRAGTFGWTRMATGMLTGYYSRRFVLQTMPTSDSGSTRAPPWHLRTLRALLLCCLDVAPIALRMMCERRYRTRPWTSETRAGTPNMDTAWFRPARPWIRFLRTQLLRPGSCRLVVASLPMTSNRSSRQHSLTRTGGRISEL